MVTCFYEPNCDDDEDDEAHASSVYNGSYK